MKQAKIIFWITTGFIFLFEGVLVALTSHSDLSIQGITHLGYPVYFVTLLAVFKVLGSITLIVPAVPVRIKEWGYAGFMIDFISAFVSILVVDGLVVTLLIPLVTIVILILSYVNYHKMGASK